MENDKSLNDIGNGWRNICSVIKRGQTYIILFGYDTKGNPKTFSIPWSPSVYYQVKYETNIKDIFNNNIAVKKFNTSYDRYKFIDSLSNSVNIVEAYRPSVEFLHYKFNKHINDENFNTQKLRIHYLDIEIAIETEFPQPEYAAYPINVITLYDTHYERYYSWVLGDIKNIYNDPNKYMVFRFSSEEALLNHFIDWYQSNRPDVVSGWNTYYFDMPYMIRRIENVLSTDVAKYISPVNTYKKMESKDGLNQIYYRVDGLTQLDLLVLYRDKFKISTALDGGYSLDNVAEHELGKNKIKYEGSIKDFYKRDFQKFWEYNIRDVELVYELDKKLNLISLARSITSLGLSEYESIYYSISYILGSLSAYSKNRDNKIFPTFKNDKNIERVAYEGAYVLPTRSGFYKNGIGVIDLNSLYPNTMISINCSPETKVGQLIKDDINNLYTLKYNGQNKPINKETLDKLLKDKCILTKNNTLLLKHSIKEGIITSWCRDTYKKRKKFQKKAKDSKKEISKIDNSSIEFNQLTDDILKYTTIQGAMKILLNSVYGVLGTPYSPIYDPDLAQSITLNGQFTNKSVMDYIKQKFNIKYKLDNFEPAIMGDTDSVAINLDPMFTEYCKKYNLENDIRKLSRTQLKEVIKEFDDFVENDINEFVKNLINTECYTEEGYNIRYGREYIASEGMFFKKKQYLVHKIDDEGIKVDAFKYTGVEVKKASIPSQMKTFLRDIYEKTCIDHWDYNTYVTYLSEIYEKFSKFDFEDIAIYKGYNTEKQVTGFLKSEKGSGAHVRAAHYYNQLLKRFNISNKYDEIRVGDMLRYVYLSQNRFNIDVIAFKNQIPKEFKEIFKIDYDLMFDKIFVKPLSGYINAMNFKKFKPSNQMEFDIFNL